MKLNKVLLNIAAVFCFIFGAVYIFSLVFIPVGIYCFVAGKKFSYKADHLLDNYAIDKKTLCAYSIFASIACFPFGLFALIAYFGIYNNNVKVDSQETIKVETVETNSENDQDEKVEAEEMVEDENTKEETEEEKLEKLEKLRNFKEKGIITEEEFEMAREQMFGEKK